MKSPFYCDHIPMMLLTEPANVKRLFQYMRRIRRMRGE